LGTLAICLGFSLGACRADPIEPALRYPAGTPLTANYVMVKGDRIRYVDTGAGPAVVLIHGLAASIYSWRHTIMPLAHGGYRVIAFDNRGFGYSEGSATGFSNAAYVDLLFELLDSLQVWDAVLVGHSMGGAIAAEAALARPDRVRGLVLVDAAGLGVRWPFMLRVARWPLVGALFNGFRGRGATAGILRMLYADPSRVTDQDVDQYYAPLAQPGAGRALRGVLRQFRFDLLRGRIDSIAAPTLAMWGSEDRLIPPSVGRVVVSELPRGAFVLVPGVGHALPEEAPEAFNRTLLAFLLQGLPGPPRDVAAAPPW
jgi:pimeloyl-ACP methyl ester carboxylesterase